MKIYAILIEPASYTVDRNNQIYDLLGIDYCFLKKTSEAQSNEKYQKMVCLSEDSWWKKIKFFNHILKNHDGVIMNGYASREFIILFLLNLVYKKTIGIDSDTQYSVPRRLYSRIIKKIYLNIIFRNKNIYGLAGGTKTHFDLFTKYGMSPERVLLMPMMIDVSKFDNPDYIKKSMKPFRFLYIGRIISCKNIDYMLSSFKKLIERGYNHVEFYVVGRGDLLESLKDKYADVPQINFRGAKFGRELFDEYKFANSLVLPSLYEPWGLVVNEAMSAGLPVIVSNKVGASFDLVDGRETGYIFDADVSESLYDCMCRMISNEVDYRNMADNSYRLMHDNWNMNLYHQCMINFINKIGKR